MSQFPGQSQEADTGPFMSGWARLCRVEELKVCEPNYVERGNRSWCVVLASDGSVSVLDDICPHAGASLSGGRIEDGCVVCPWHSWCFSLEDGRNPDSPVVIVRRYEAIIRDGWVCLRSGSADQR